MMIPLPKLLDGTGEARRIRPIKVSINENQIPLSTASMTILKDDVFPERSYVELFTVNGSAGVYRTRAPEVGYGSETVTVTLEHGICEVGDYIVREKTENAQMTLTAAVQHFFSFYGGSRWRLGSVSASGYVVVSSSYQNVLSAILSAMQQVPGAMMAFDFTTTPWTVSIRSRDTTVGAEGRLSRNIQSAKVKRDDSGLATRVWLEGLGGAGVIGKMDADTISTYGVIEVNLSGNNYTPAQANTVANAYLERHKRPIYSITIEGEDLSRITGESLDRVAIGKKYRLAIPDDGVVLEENVTAIRWPDVYDAPGKCIVNLAEPPETAVTFLQTQANNVSGSIGGLSGSVDNVKKDLIETEEDLDLLWQKTGVDELGQEETLMTRIQINAEGIAQEVTRARLAEGTKLDKSQDYQTVNDLISEAQSLASAAATSAKNASIAKTAQYQTAEAIVATAVATGISEGNQRYIAQTTSFQTADAIKNEAVRVAGNNAAAAYIAKSGGYNTVNQIINQAETLAQAAAVSAKNASIAKTSRMQTADAIVETAVAIAESDAGDTYIAKTYRYQTADEICQVAEQYTDTKAGVLSSQIQQNANKIGLVVTQSGGQDVINAASIVLGINDQSGSYVKIKADAVDIEGIVSATEARIDKILSGDTTATVLQSRWVVAETLHIQQDFYFGPDNNPWHIGPINVTIGGTQYTLLGAV